MSEAIRAETLLFIELKRIDDQAYRLKLGLDQIPREISEVETKLQDHETAFTAAKAAFTDAEKKLRSAEGELKAKEDELHKAEGKMMEVKTNAEYVAAMKENEGRKEAKGILEEKVLLLMDELEIQRQSLKSLEKEYATEKARLQSEKKKLEQQKVQLESELQTAYGERSVQSEKLDPKFQQIYKKQIALDSRAIASAQNGQCSACNMQVRPQIYNEIVGFVAIHQCGSCKRILVPTALSPAMPPTSENVSAPAE